MAYTPNPYDATQPIDSVFARTAAAEFRALKLILSTLSGTSSYIGVWSTLTGAVAAGKVVAHSDTLWMALEAILDVTLSEPGVALAWIDTGSVKRAGDTMLGHLNGIAGASGTQMPQAQETAMLATTQFGFRNRLINPFSENQRGLTSVADDAYCLDRWYVLTESGNVTVAQVTDPEVGAPYGIRLTQPDVAAKRLGLAQIIESKHIRQFASSAMNLFARVKLSAATAVRYAIIEHTGTADTVTSDVVNTWASATFTPSNFFIAGVNILKTGTVTPGAATWGSIDDWAALGAGVKNIIIFIWTEDTLIQNGTLEICRPQYEPGVIATQHEWRMDELARCQAYYEILRYRPNGGTALSSLLAAGADYFQWFYKTVKRVAPTITLVSGAWVGGTPTISIGTDSASFLRATGAFNAAGVAGAVALSATAEL